MPAIAIDSPVGRLTIHEVEGMIARLSWDDSATGTPTPLLVDAAAQLAAYFDRSLTRFDLPFTPAPTPQNQAIRDAMTSIPYGGTLSYGALAATIGSSARAVGQACARNPLPIFVPCHRVLGDSEPGHYSGGHGAVTKQWLLVHEGALLL